MACVMAADAARTASPDDRICRSGPTADKAGRGCRRQAFSRCRRATEGCASAACRTAGIEAYADTTAARAVASRIASIARVNRVIMMQGRPNKCKSDSKGPHFHRLLGRHESLKINSRVSGFVIE